MNGEPTIRIVSNPYQGNVLYEYYDDSAQEWGVVDKGSRLRNEKFREGKFSEYVDSVVRIIKEEFFVQNKIYVCFRGVREEYEKLAEACRTYEDNIVLEEPQEYLPEISFISSEIEKLFAQIEFFGKMFMKESPFMQESGRELLEQKQKLSGEPMTYIKCGQIIYETVNFLIREKDEEEKRMGVYSISISILEQEILKLENKKKEKLEDFFLSYQKQYGNVNTGEKNKQEEQRKSEQNKSNLKEKAVDVMKSIPEFARAFTGIGYKKAEKPQKDEDTSADSNLNLDDLQERAAELNGIIENLEKAKKELEIEEKSYKVKSDGVEDRVKCLEGLILEAEKVQEMIQCKD